FDVARVAGVSHATVSRVVNGRQNVRDETRPRVEVAMRDLGYVAHVSARALASGRTQVIGLLAQEVDNAFFTAVIGGVDQQGSAQRCCRGGRGGGGPAGAARECAFWWCPTPPRGEKEGEYVPRLSRGMV